MDAFEFNLYGVDDQNAAVAIIREYFIEPISQLPRQHSTQTRLIDDIVFKLCRPSDHTRRALLIATLRVSVASHYTQADSPHEIVCREISAIKESDDVNELLRARKFKPPIAVSAISLGLSNASREREYHKESVSQSHKAPVY